MTQEEAYLMLNIAERLVNHLANTPSNDNLISNLQPTLEMVGKHLDGAMDSFEGGAGSNIHYHDGKALDKLAERIADTIKGYRHG